MFDAPPHSDARLETLDRLASVFPQMRGATEFVSSFPHTLPNLETLNILIDILEEEVPSYRSLTQLTVFADTWVDFHCLSALTTLVELTVNSSELENAQILCTFPRLTFLDVGYICDSVEEAVTKLSQLEALVGSVGPWLDAQYLSSLHTLCLGNAYFERDEELQAFLRLDRTLPNLRFLTISCRYDHVTFTHLTQLDTLILQKGYDTNLFYPAYLNLSQLTRLVA